MRHIRREGLEARDLIVEAGGELLQRTGERPNLVAAIGGRKISWLWATPLGQCIRPAPQPYQRPHDCRGGQRREAGGRGDRRDENLEETQADVVDRLQDAERGLRDDDRAADPAVVPDRDGAEEGQGPLSRRWPARRAVPPGKRLSEHGAYSVARGAVPSPGAPTIQDRTIAETASRAFAIAAPTR